MQALLVQYWLPFYLRWLNVLGARKRLRTALPRRCWFRYSNDPDTWIHNRSYRLGMAHANVLAAMGEDRVSTFRIDTHFRPVPRPEWSPIDYYYN